MMIYLAGTELVGLAATETPDPRATMPGAVKGTFWRIVSRRIDVRSMPSSFALI